MIFSARDAARVAGIAPATASTYVWSYGGPGLVHLRHGDPAEGLVTHDPERAARDLVAMHAKRDAATRANAEAARAELARCKEDGAAPSWHAGRRPGESALSGGSAKNSIR